MDESLTMTPSSDKELAAQMATGSRDAFEELVRRYKLRLFYFLRHRTASDEDAEDMIQETFLKAYRNIGRYDPHWKFSTWLFTIAARQAISHYRRHKGVITTTLPASTALDPEELLAQKENSRNIWTHAKTLPPAQYEALWLRYGEDMSIDELARVLNKKIITTRVLLHRARLNLAERLNQTELEVRVNPADTEFVWNKEES